MNNIIRSEKKGKGGYTCISNAVLQSKTLRPVEVGVLVYLLSLPADFVIHKSSIWQQVKIGRDQFDKVWKKLTELGYIHTIKYKDNSTGSKFSYRHVVYEVPENIPNPVKNNIYVTTSSLETSDWKYLHIQSNNTNEPVPVSNQLNIVEVRHGQEVLGQKELDQHILGPTSRNNDLSIVPPPQLSFGSGRDNQEGQCIGSQTTGSRHQPRPVLDARIAGEQEITISGDIPETEIIEFIPDENDINNFMEALDELFKEDFPNWKQMLKNYPIYAFVKETRKLHSGIPEIIEMITILKKRVFQ